MKIRFGFDITNESHSYPNFLAAVYIFNGRTENKIVILRLVVVIIITEKYIGGADLSQRLSAGRII